MLRLKSKVVLISFAVIGLFIAGSILGQDAPDKSKAAKSAKEREKQEFWKRRKINRSRDSALKAHMKHQSKAVRKRMKKDAKKAKSYNNIGA